MSATPPLTAYVKEQKQDERGVTFQWCRLRLVVDSSMQSDVIYKSKKFRKTVCSLENLNQTHEAFKNKLLKKNGDLMIGRISMLFMRSLSLEITRH